MNLNIRGSSGGFISSDEPHEGIERAVGSLRGVSSALKLLTGAVLGTFVGHWQLGKLNEKVWVYPLFALSFLAGAIVVDRLAHRR